MKDKNLALFLNYFSSLKAWDDNGTFQKEMLLYRRLTEQFGKIYIFSYGGKRDLEYADILPKNIIIIPKPAWLPSYFYEISLPFLHWKIIRNCAVYKTNQNSGALAPSLAKLLFHKKFIVRSGYIGSEFARLNKLPFYARFYFWLAENISYRLCDKAFIPQGDSEILLKKYPFLKNKIIIINNPINTELFKKLDVEKKYDIVYQARLDAAQKNHEGLLKAIEGTGLKLLLIGKGAAKNDIIASAKQKNVVVTLLERVPNEEMPAMYNSAKICVFPSFFEGNPKALLECMACELPIIACDVPGVSNLIRNGVSGLLSAPEESQLIRGNILKIADNPELGKALGNNARQFILANYSLEKIFAREFEIYKKLLKVE